MCVCSQIPMVLIDNMSDPLATIITVGFGDLLGELLDTVSALWTLRWHMRLPRSCTCGAL